ncbi:SIR2 family protein [Kocuria flava]|uniref:SIR2 family protein n=1 Tax=Kocuria flava TaxID=446860 RepID=UPI002F951314
MTVEIENEASFLTAIRSEFNLFAGAGFSVLAQHAGKTLPVGEQLSNELRSHFGVDLEKNLSLPQIHTIINSLRSQELDAFLRDRYSVDHFDKRYSVVERMSPRAIFTTNIDNLFQNIFRNSTQSYLNDLYVKGAALSSRSAVDLIQLHGSVTDPNRPLTFGTLDIAAAASRDPDKWAFLRQRLEAYPTLYWGYSLNDSGTLQSLRTRATNESTIGDAWLQIRPNSAETALADYYRALNFQLIVAETDELLDYLASQLLTTSTQAYKATSSLENIPPNADVAVRPLEDYFLGAAPSWSDIYGGKLHKTSYYRFVANRVAAGQSTILAGIPASGKTTLLMQVLAHVPFDGPRMMFDGLGNAEAELLRRRIGNGQALVGLDNVASDADALAVLSKAPNVVIVAADRDYTLSSARNIVNKTNIEIHGVTSLTPQDQQSIWQSIPLRIRSSQITFPEVEGRAAPSTFEFIKENVTGQLLGERLIEYVTEMLKEDPDQAHMLILACYMHSTKVPLSMDIAISFFRDRITDYRTVYSMLEAVGDLLQEYEGEFCYEEQDYFSARSIIVSESVIEGVPSSGLRNVLSNFHMNITPLRVPGFKTFRRRGYDSKIFARSFPNYVEGAALYDHILSKPEINGDPYVVQHKALFLAEKRQFELAFREIDRVRGGLRYGRVNWTIENSYNKILFRANIDKAPYVAEAEHLCRRALEGLDAAYEKDKRKGVHALVFADSAIAFSKVVLDDETVGLLERAEEMLTSVIGSDPWLDRPKYARGDVRRRLKDLR